MKQILLLIVALTGIFEYCNCQNTDTAGITINHIKKVYRDINRCSNLTLETADINDGSTEGGELKKYSRNDTLYKAILTFYGETGKTTTEYYFDNGLVIFVYENVVVYDKPIYIDSKANIASTVLNRYYFKDELLCRWIGTTGKAVDRKSYAKKENEIKNEIRKYIVPK